MCNNLLLTGWILFQATRMNALEAWQISNPSGAGNLMAAQINMTLPLILTKIHESRGGIRILFLFVLAMNFVAVFLVMSRNGIGSMLIILTLYVLFKYKKIAFCVIGLILGCVVFLDSITRIPFIHNLLVKMRFVGFVPQAPRSVIWHISWDHILQNPLLGVGPGRPRKILAVLDIDHAHNNFMQVAFETGLPSAAVFASLMLLLIWLVVRMSFRNRESFVYTLSIVAYMVFSWTGGPLAFPGATLLLAACVNEARVAIKRQEKLKQALFLQRSSPVLPRTVRAA
jgi:O-antigen ligase